MTNIIQISEKELKEQGEFTERKNSVVLNDCFFKKVATFSLSEKQRVLDSYQIKPQNDQVILLVEHKFWFVIWQEEVLINSNQIDTTENSSAEQNHQAFQPQETSSPSPSNKNIEQKIPTKKIIKRYRGQVYETEVPDLSSLQQQNSQKKTLKYRGKSI